MFALDISGSVLDNGKTFKHSGQQRIERVISTTDRLVGRHLTIRLNTMLQAEEFPAGVADLHTWRGT